MECKIRKAGVPLTEIAACLDIPWQSLYEYICAYENEEKEGIPENILGLLDHVEELRYPGKESVWDYFNGPRRTNTGKTADTEPTELELRYVKKAADDGDPEAQREYGRMISATDPELGRAYLQAAADAGDGEAVWIMLRNADERKDEQTVVDLAVELMGTDSPHRFIICSKPEHYSDEALRRMGERIDRSVEEGRPDAKMCKALWCFSIHLMSREYTDDPGQLVAGRDVRPMKRSAPNAPEHVMMEPAMRDEAVRLFTELSREPVRYVQMYDDFVNSRSFAFIALQDLKGFEASGDEVDCINVTSDEALTSRYLGGIGAGDRAFIDAVLDYTRTNSVRSAGMTRLLDAIGKGFLALLKVGVESDGEIFKIVAPSAAGIPADEAFELGRSFFGIGNRYHYTARALFHYAAVRGHGEAAFYLGYMREKRMGGDRKQDDAFHGGYGGGQVLYERRIGSERSPCGWYLKAAENGCEMAKTRLRFLIDSCDLDAMRYRDSKYLRRRDAPSSGTVS